VKRSKALLTLGFALACAAITFGLGVCAQAQTVTNLANFDRETGDAPFGSVIQATDGNFYGTTAHGGAHSEGNVFRVTPSGDLSSIYSFCSQANCADGQYPYTAPVLGSDGNLYGVTSSGGKNAGIVYKLTLGGKITILHTFCSSNSSCTDGNEPTGITQGSDGNFYGTATWGGEFENGTIFKISPTGNFTLLHTFCSLANCADGGIPVYPPIQGSDGNFYGGTNAGGTAEGQGGVVYELTSEGTLKVLQNFCYPFGDTCDTGAYPTRLVQDAHGNFFGTTATGGEYNTGTAFEITSANRFIVLHRFNYSGGVDAATGLTLANDGNLYGVALNNDNFASASSDYEASGYGIIFEITPAGAFTTLASFTDYPIGPLFQGTDGSLYGTTAGGGEGNDGYGYGTVFKLSNGLNPLVETVPVAGPVGQSVFILGNNLTGSTSVKFNGVEAAFTVGSDTYIQATVPTGATTGVVSVVTPSGTLKSNLQFVVSE
jgi:uncharacterized repeat protein (TIGR03803 family)